MKRSSPEVLPRVGMHVYFVRYLDGVELPEKTKSDWVLLQAHVDSFRIDPWFRRGWDGGQYDFDDEVGI